MPNHRRGQTRAVLYSKLESGKSIWVVAFKDGSASIGLSTSVGTGSG